ncbi:thiamine-phosphate kinase [Massilia sp. DWR3-1-1]|uniref:thiamine-phosphate kinase n=1 Tax=Massilia sp. DWR3-1-1 TaxID=2804559 RepID=UPI003CF87258
MLSEFDLIKQYFVRDRPSRATLGIGDDCALLTPRAGTELAISTDMLVENRHFFAGADPRCLGHKALAVNLSDLAAMGATPLAFTLALAMPKADPVWLAGFSEGLFALADLHGCELIGGDTTRGPLTISITIFGEIAPGQALQRSRAVAGDDIWVSGTLGDARLTLAGLRDEFPIDQATLALASPRMHLPEPRVALGQALAQGALAHAALDISDGFAGDLGHILAASRVGASVNVDALPAGAALAREDSATRRRFCAQGGDDYELCFTADPARRDAIVAAAAACATAVTRVGVIDAQAGLRLVDGNGRAVALDAAGFDHFALP